MNGSEKVDIDNVERLVKACQAGDRGAFDVLVRLYQQPAMKIAVRMLGDANKASEAVQGGFIKAYLQIDKLREPKRFGVWLMRIISNTAVSQLRAAKRRAVNIRIADDYKDDKAASPVDKEIARELKEAIGSAMSQLSKKQAKAIALFGLEELTHEEVAGIMGCSVAAARWHVFKARQKLKVLLKEYLE